ADAVFADFNGADLVGLHAATARDALDTGQVRVHADDDAPDAEGLVKQRQPPPQPLPCGEVGDFHGEHVRELVRHQAGQEVRIPVDGAVAVRLRIQLVNLPAQGGGGVDGGFEK